MDVYKGDDNFSTFGATLLSDLDIQETYKAIDSVATGKIPSLFCDSSNEHRWLLLVTFNPFTQLKRLQDIVLGQSMPDTNISKL